MGRVLSEKSFHPKFMFNYKLSFYVISNGIPISLKISLALEPNLLDSIQRTWSYFPCYFGLKIFHSLDQRLVWGGGLSMTHNEYNNLRKIHFTFTLGAKHCGNMVLRLSC